MAKKSLFAALEELNEAGMGVDEAAVVDGGETEMGEAAEAEVGMTEQVDTVTEAQADEDTLSAISDVLEESIPEGGVDQTTARVAEIAVESIYKRLGVTKKSMPSMESFGSRSSRVRATQIAIESIGETLSNIWQAIKAAFVKLWTWMKNMWKSLFDASTKLANRSDAMLARLKNLSGTAKESDFADKTLVSKLSTGNGDLKSADLIKLLGNFDGKVNQLKELRKTSKDAADMLKKPLEKVDSEVTAGFVFTALTDLTDEFASKFFAKQVMSSAKKPHDDTSVYTSGELPGNKCIVLTVPSKTAGDATKMKELVSYIGIAEETFDKKREANEDSKCEVGQINSLVEIVKKVKQVLVSFDGNKDLENSIEKSSKDLESAVDKALKSIASKVKSENKDNKDKDVAKDANEGFAIVMKGASKAATLFSSYSSQIQKMAITTSKYSLDYVEKCAALYKKD